MDRSLGTRCNARLVACVLAKIEREGLSETYASVLKLTSIRILLAIVTKLWIYLFRIDLVTAFLYNELDEQVYMVQPEGFAKGNLKATCRFDQSQYKRKQALREWNEEIDSFF